MIVYESRFGLAIHYKLYYWHKFLALRHHGVGVPDRETCMSNILPARLSPSRLDCHENLPDAAPHDFLDIYKTPQTFIQAIIIAGSQFSEILHIFQKFLRFGRLQNMN